MVHNFFEICGFEILKSLFMLQLHISSLFSSTSLSGLLCSVAQFTFLILFFFFTLFQAKCEAAYFIVVLHQLRLVVIAVRGTETPEDLITDGLCKECILSSEDLDGLMKYLSLSLSLY